MGSRIIIPNMTKQALSEQQWRAKLTPEQFAICRQKGTERPFTGRYTQCKENGVYYCVCCNNRLFDAAEKFDSGSGWPSFWDVIDAKNISKQLDQTHGMKRVEVSCQACGAHLGHVFEDGPKPTGLRYCINSTALHFVAKA